MQAGAEHSAERGAGQQVAVAVRTGAQLDRQRDVQDGARTVDGRIQGAEQDDRQRDGLGGQRLEPDGQEDDVRWSLEFLARTEIPGSVLDGDCPSEFWNDVPLLSLLSPGGQQQLTDGSFRREFAAGSTIVSRWAIDRDFYVVLEGEVSVRRDGVVVGRLGPGDFFGEIAASDWGSGYGYVRTADVNADSDTAVLLVAAEVLSSLMASEPRLRARVLAARADRLTRL